MVAGERSIAIGRPASGTSLIVTPTSRADPITGPFHMERAMASAPAEQPDPDDGGQPSNVIPLREGDSAIAVDRKAEGGLTLRFAFDLPKIPSIFMLKTWSHQHLINGGLIAVVAIMAAFLVYQNKFASSDAAVVHEATTGLLRPNVETEFNPDVESPIVAEGAYVDKLASVIGNVAIGKRVFVAPFASIRGDEGQPVVIGEGSNVQDGVVIHALETFDGSKVVEGNLVTVNGKKYAVWIGKNVSLAHQSQVHGPAAVGNQTFVGMQALVFKATIGDNVVIEPGAKVIGVKVADGRYVPAGSVVTSQAAADALPTITAAYPFATLNNGVLQVNQEFADKYLDLANGVTASGERSAEAPVPKH